MTDAGPALHLPLPPRSPRRVLAGAFAVSALLHLSFLFGLPAWRSFRPQEPPVYEALLVPLVLPAPTPTPSAAPAKAAPRPRPRRAVARPAPAPLPAEPQTAEAAPAPPDAANEPNVPAAPVAAAEPAPEPTPAAVPPPPEEAPPSVPAPEPPTELPASIRIAFRMTSSLSDGVAHYSWTRDGDRFEIDSTMQAEGFMVGVLLGVIHQVSVGRIGPGGLEPSSFRMRRGEGNPDTADFLRATQELKLSRGGQPARTLPLPAGLQDMQSFLFQLGFDAPRLKGPDDRIDVLVTNGRKVYRHRFRLVGTETVETRAGPVETVHLRSDATDPEDAYDAWLMPGRFHLPVKLRFHAGRFPVELVATSIRTTP